MFTWNRSDDGSTPAALDLDYEVRFVRAWKSRSTVELLRCCKEYKRSSAKVLARLDAGEKLQIGLGVWRRRLHADHQGAPVRWKQQLCIGDVGFKDSRTGEYVCLRGRDRVDFLRRFYNKQHIILFEPCDLRQGRGYRTITWDEVRWDTAGKEVIGAY